MRQRIGVMGGTFDPIHNGHLVAASEVAWIYQLDQVIFVPTGRPAFKQDRVVTNAEDRYLMTVIAVAENPQFSVSRVDIDRSTITYTVDTLHDLGKEYPQAEFFFISGADAISQISRWKDADKLWDMAQFIAVTRPGYPTETITHTVPQHPISVMEIPALAISSTDIRQRVARRAPIWYLVPDGVVRYIAKLHLYEDNIEADTE